MLLAYSALLNCATYTISRKVLEALRRVSVPKRPLTQSSLKSNQSEL
jgi:hypothetical protein